MFLYLVLRKPLDFKVLCAADGELLLAPRLMPREAAAESVIGIAHTVNEL